MGGGTATGSGFPVLTVEELQLLLIIVSNLDPARYEGELAKALIHRCRTLKHASGVRVVD